MKPHFKASFKTLDDLTNSPPPEIARERGLKFEKLINDMMADEGILLRASYHTSDNRSEQIDGAVEIGGRIYLLEMKWTKSDQAASDLYAFIGKIENKFQGTLGIFVSRNTLSDNFLDALNKGRRQSVIVIHGKDVTEIFNNDFTFETYISHVTKVLSYDNLVHLPVEKYLKIRNSVAPVPAANTRQEARIFITDVLFGPPVDKEKLQAEVSLSDPSTYDIVFTYIISSYFQIVQDARRTFNYTKWQNYSAFLKVYKPTNTVMLEQAIAYYTKYLQKHFVEYGQEDLTSIFPAFYPSLPAESKATFEQFAVNKFNEVMGQWEEENRLTFILKPIWSSLSEKTRIALGKNYLDIFITTRKDTYAQKEFANWLVSSSSVDQKQIADWLDEKIRNAKDLFTDSSTEERARFLASTYLPVHSHLKIKIDDWVAYIKDKVKKFSE